MYVTDVETESSLATEGWVIVPGVVPPALVGRVRQDLVMAEATCRATRERNGLDGNTAGTAHHLLSFGGAFLDLLGAIPLNDAFDGYFHGKCIVNSYGGVINARSRPSYVCQVHRDIRTYSAGIPLMLNLLVMLDDFTLENGATHLLTGSHLVLDRPTDEAFFATAARAVGKAGDVLLFDSNLWHAAGMNTTHQLRCAITVTLTPPYFKQQLDYCRALGEERIARLPDRVKQLIGYFSRTPTTLDEWYQPPDRRMYRPGQG